MECVRFDFPDGTVENHAGFLERLHTVDRVDKNSLLVLTSKVFFELDDKLISCNINARILVSQKWSKIFLPL